MTNDGKVSLPIMLLCLDIPHSRRDITKYENVRWLLRNLPINNSGRLFCGDVMMALRELALDIQQKEMDNVTNTYS